MDVAVVRGPALNKWEMQNYEPLRPALDVVAIGSRRGHYDLADLRLPVRRLATLARGRGIRRFLPDERLLGLGRAVAGASIVHAAETFIASTDQVVRDRGRRDYRIVVTCWENIPFLHDDDAVLRERKRRVQAGADLFVAVTPSAREALLVEGVDPGRVVVLPMGVDVEAFAPRPRDAALLEELGIPRQARVVLYCGRLIREKGLVELLLAARTVAAGREDVRFLLVGSGPERGRLAAAAERLGLRDLLVFAPAQRYARMPALHAVADVFVLPSLPAPYWREQFGMVLAEALACGRAVVATASGSIPDVVGEAGVLVPPYDPEALAAAIGDLLDDDERRAELARRGRALAEERYDARRVASRLRELYGALA